MPKRIDHVAIIVRNIEQALVFYRDTLGITPGEIIEVPTEQVRIAFLPMGGPGGSESQSQPIPACRNSLKSAVRVSITSAWKWTISTLLLLRCRRKAHRYWINSRALPPRVARSLSIPRLQMGYCWS